jgi:two-component system KDP operon response regulator KdpE
MPPTQSLILVIEDEAPIRHFLKVSLENANYRLLEAFSGQEGLTLAASHNPDVILLDLGLPDVDGLEVISRLRQKSLTPIIVVSARGRESDKIKGLDAGADDYLTKPFSVGELSARIRAALRHGARAGQEARPPVFVSGGLKVDLDSRLVWMEGREVHLTPMEYKLLAVMVGHAGKVVTHRQLLKEVWGQAAGQQSNYTRLYMHQLRHKLEADPARPLFLRTEPGVGYRLLCQD